MVRKRDSTSFMLAIPFQADGELMSGLRGPTSGIVSWQISGKVVSVNDSARNNHYGVAIPDLTRGYPPFPVPDNESIRIHTIKRVVFTTVSDAVFSVWGLSETGTGGAQLFTQAAEIVSNFA